MDIDYNDQRIKQGLTTLVSENKSAKLSNYTTWEWDEVHLFHEYTDREFIEHTVGAPVIKSDFYQSKASLLVFEDHGRPVKAIGIPGDYLRGENNQVSFPADAILTASTGGYLELTG